MKQKNCKCGNQSCDHIPQSWLDIGYGEGKLTYVGMYKGCPFYSNPTVPKGFIYAINDNDLKLKPFKEILSQDEKN